MNLRSTEKARHEIRSDQVTYSDRNEQCEDNLEAYPPYTKKAPTHVRTNSNDYAVSWLKSTCRSRAQSFFRGLNDFIEIVRFADHLVKAFIAVRKLLDVSRIGTCDHEMTAGERRVCAQVLEEGPVRLVRRGSVFVARDAATRFAITV
jgi:hypothetical protein